MENKKKIQNKKARRGTKKITLILGLIGILFLFKNVDLSWLDDSPREYNIPQGAISGGEFIGEDGITYERYQLGDKFYIMSKKSGAKIPQN